MKKSKRTQKPKMVSALGSDSEELYSDLEAANPKSRDFFYNEIDEFNHSREQIPLDSDDDGEIPLGKVQEEVLPLPDDSEDDEVYNNDYYSRMTQKDEIASDIEDDDDNLPNDKAWGKRKSSYYSTDFVDKDYDGFQGSDIELAEAEEQEATKIQKRLLQELSEEDFGLEWITPTPKTGSQTEDVGKQKIATDLSALNDDEKLELLKKESPELLCVVKDFEKRMTELKEKILPLEPLVADGTIPPGPAAEYLTVKRELIYLYCTNISFYMMIRCQDVSVKHHPVVKRLLTFRKLFEQLDPMGEMLESDIQTVLNLLNEGKDVKHANASKETVLLETNLRKRESVKEKKRKKVSFSDGKLKVSQKPVKMLKVDRMETADEKEALQMYELMRKKTQKKEVLSEGDTESEEDEVLEGEEDEKEDRMLDSFREESYQEESLADDEKREITYQIAKNKGLTPHRKKEYRNPRVRHRVKFQKAKVRRKGQYKEPRKELQRYGGEVSGIRIGTKRGIKLK